RARAERGDRGDRPVVRGPRKGRNDRRGPSPRSRGKDRSARPRAQEGPAAGERWPVRRSEGGRRERRRLAGRGRGGGARDREALASGRHRRGAPDRGLADERTKGATDKLAPQGHLVTVVP